ncbi:MAG TPA: radical SAM family heme chaperone HemW [Candidatus Binataceae bacterium]|nr:radical SAM family heme chaperone HemW [Candidatus Binataceae bacterium]
MAFSLYLHIPYCHAKCPYCDFNSHAASSWPEAEYTQALIAEMRQRSKEPAWHGERIKTIFFGGGTPSLFDPRSIAELIERADQLFGIEPLAEITLEANPGTIDQAKISGFKTAGVNRMSFGAQSFNPAILKFLGRIHSAEQIREAARMTHRAGFSRFNLDLIFAVPGQTSEGLLYDIEQIVALEPDHVSAYNLTFEEGTVFFADLQRGRIQSLPDEMQATMFAMVRGELPLRGFPMYEISNYAQAGHEARHNLTYWHAESYLGLGAGAHSFARSGPGGRRWWNERAPSRYIEATSKTGIAEAGNEPIDARTAMSEYVFLNLRLRAGFALVGFRDRFGCDFFETFAQQSRDLLDAGLLIESSDRIFLSDRGLELADSVFAEFV